MLATSFHVSKVCNINEIEDAKGGLCKGQGYAPILSRISPLSRNISMRCVTVDEPTCMGSAQTLACSSYTLHRHPHQPFTQCVLRATVV